MSLYDTLVAVGANKPPAKPKPKSPMAGAHGTATAGFGTSPKRREVRAPSATPKPLRGSGTARAGVGASASGNVAVVRRGSTPPLAMQHGRAASQKVAEKLGRAVAEQSRKGLGLHLTKAQAVALGHQTVHAKFGALAEGNVAHESLPRLLTGIPIEPLRVLQDAGTLLALAKHAPGVGSAARLTDKMLLKADKGIPGAIHSGAQALGSYIAHHPPTLYGTGGAPAVGPSTLTGRKPSAIGGTGGAVIGGTPVSPKVAKYLGEALTGGIDVFGQTGPSLAYALGPAAHGDARTTTNRLAQPYVDIVKDPKKALSGPRVAGTGLLIGGAYGALGRGAGGVARSGLLGSRARASGETLRGVASHPNSAIEENIRVSKNLATASVQKAAIRSGSKQAAKLRAEAAALDAKGGPHDTQLAKAKRIEADRVDPFTVTNQRSARLTATSVRPARGQVNRLQDERQAFDHSIGVTARGDAMRASDQAVKHGLHRSQGLLVRLVAEGEHASPAGIHTWLKGVRENLAKMVEEDRTRRAAGEQAVNTVWIHKAQENITLTEKALKNTKGEHWQAVLAAANGLSKLHNQKLEPAMVAQDVLAKGQMDKARLFTGSMRRDAGYQFNDKPITTAAGTTTPSILDASGKTATVEGMIRDYNRIAARGGYVDSPVHLSQQPNLTGRAGRRSDFYSNPYDAATASDGVRSGAAYDKGYIDLNPEALRAGAARKAKLVNNARAFKSFATDWGYRTKSGDASTMVTKRSYREAKQQADLIEAKTGQEYVPVALEPFKAKSHELLNAIHDDSVLGPDHLDTATYDRLSSAFDKNAPHDKWVLIPKAAAKRMQDHMDALRGNAATKAIQRLNGFFRRSVLMRPSWILGNTFEGTYRGLLTQALPGLSPEWWMLRRIYDEMGPTSQRAAMQARSGATHGDYVQRQPRRSNDQIIATHGKRGAAYEAAATSAAVTKAMHVVDRVNHAWFSQINGFFENPLREAQYAKAVANQANLSMAQRASAYPLIHKAFPETYHRAVQQFLDGQIHTRDQIEVGRLVDRAYGKYDKFPPGTRHWISTYTPFVAWTMNAVSFLLRTLPRDHPVLTSVMASASLAAQDWERSKGLGGTHYAGKLPGFLQGTIPGAGGSHLTALKHYTPHGLATDPLNTIAGAVAPQAMGTLNALRGYDWKNKPLRNADGTPFDVMQTILYALSEGGKTFIAPVGLGVQFNQKGGTFLEKVNRFLTSSLRYTTSKPRTSSSASPAHQGWGAPTSSTPAHSAWGAPQGTGAPAASGWGTP